MAADIEPSTDKALRKREAFFEICQSFTYSDKLALANYFGIAYFTVQRWSYGDNIPDEQTREDVIDWYNRGKPLKRLMTCDSLSGSY